MKIINRVKKRKQRIKKAILFTLLLILLLFIYIPKHFTYNISPSMPKGIYYMNNIKNINKGDVVLLDIPKNSKDLIYSRGYLEKRAKFLIKEVEGYEGDRISIGENKVYLNNVYIGDIKSKDSRGLNLNTFLKDGIIPKNKFLLLGVGKNSYDSKYFGLIDKSEILKKCYLIYRID